MTIHVGVGGTNKKLTRIDIGASGAWKKIVKAWIGSGSAWKAIFSRVFTFTISAGNATADYIGLIGLAGTIDPTVDQFGGSTGLSDVLVLADQISVSQGVLQLRLFVDPGQNYVQSIIANGVTQTGAGAASYVYDGVGFTGTWRWSSKFNFVNTSIYPVDISLS